MLTCDEYFMNKNVKINFIGECTVKLEGKVLNTNSSGITLDVKKSNHSDYSVDSIVFLPFGLSYTMVCTERPKEFDTSRFKFHNDK